MAEVDWGSEANEAPKAKSRVPKWAWFCGGGCVLALIVAGVVAVLVARGFSEMMDADKQRAELQAVLPFEVLPEGSRVVGIGAFAGFMPGIEDAWVIHIDGEQTQLQITRHTEGASDELRDSIASGELGGAARREFGPLGIHALAHGELELQGRKLPWMSFQTFELEGEAPASASAQDGARGTEDERDGGRWRAKLDDALSQRLMLVDLTREGETRALVVQIQRLGKGPAVAPSEAARLLAPFQLGERK